MTPSRPGIRPAVVLGLALESVLHHLGRSVVTLVIVGLAASVVVGTTGRADATRRAVLDRLDAPANRIIRVVDRTGTAGMDVSALDRIRSVTEVEWALALGHVGSVGRNAGLGDPDTVGNAGEAAGSRLYWGDLMDAAGSRLESGRVPGPGEAVLGVHAGRLLGLASGIGTVDDDMRGPTAAVGVVRYGEAVSELNAYILIDATDEREADVGEFVVLADSASSIERLVELLPALTAPDDLGSVGIERSEEFVRLRNELAVEVSTLNAAILFGSLVVSAVLVSVNLFGAIAERRREFGLRRTQGATRSTIGALVILEVGVLALLGSLVGAVAGTALVASQTSLPPDPSLAAAIAALLALAAVLGSLPAAAIAALREPLFAIR
ncbi:hypothetical protein BH23CHL10_BH23CHL10_13670 [soil metagenome]